MRIETVDGDKIFLIRDYFTPDECAEAIAMAEEAGFTDAPITTGGGQVIHKEMRNNDRVMLERPAYAEWLWQRAKPFVPERDRVWSALGLNERLRFYRYDPGQKFSQHFDGYFRRNACEISRLTFMVYLNDDFEGGETVFYGGWRTFCEERFRVRPTRGTALLFVHAQLHEGAEVKTGRKYVLRSDVMYRLDEGASDPDADEE